MVFKDDTGYLTQLKTAEIKKVILPTITLPNVTVLLSNIAFLIFAVLDF